MSKACQSLSFLVIQSLKSTVVNRTFNSINEESFGIMSTFPLMASKCIIWLYYIKILAEGPGVARGKKC